MLIVLLLLPLKERANGIARPQRSLELFALPYRDRAHVCSAATAGSTEQQHIQHHILQQQTSKYAGSLVSNAFVVLV
jgi:hypothetical protein